MLVRSGFPTCRVEPSVVDCWALLSRDTRRAAVITAVAERLATPDRLSTRLAGGTRSDQPFT